MSRTQDWWWRSRENHIALLETKMQVLGAKRNSCGLTLQQESKYRDLLSQWKEEVMPGIFKEEQDV